MLHIQREPNNEQIMSLRARLGSILDTPLTQNVIIAVIAVNAVTLGMETSDTLMAAAGPLIIGIDRICLAIFTVEIAAKLLARGPAFFRNGWNLFDFSVVAPNINLRRRAIVVFLSPTIWKNPEYDAKI